MTIEQQAILNIISDYLHINPNIRFGQALFNLGITEFATKDPFMCNHQLKDIYADTDSEILQRIKIP